MLNEIKKQKEAIQAGARFVRTDVEVTGECPYCQGRMVRPVSEVYSLNGQELKFWVDSLYSECEACGNV